MSPIRPKRLIEIDLPIREISAHARKEKSIRHGNISTLHIWWARRPLAACRAVICASLWPDPVDEKCPQAFRDIAALALCYFAEQVRNNKELAVLCANHWTRWVRTTPALLQGNNPACWPDLRYGLLDFIADFANWDASTTPAFLDTARLLTHIAHICLQNHNWQVPQVRKSYANVEDMNEDLKEIRKDIADMPRPLVIDPFAGGGAIPLEALRTGADVFATDLNPVAVILNKIVLEYIPKYGDRLAVEVKKWGQRIGDKVYTKLGTYYLETNDISSPIAYLWARTIICEGPKCGVRVPLLQSLWLSKGGEKSFALHLSANNNRTSIVFDILEKRKTKWFSTSYPEKEIKVSDFEGTARKGSVTCPLCGYTTPVERVRMQMQEQNGGANNSLLYCIVYVKPGAQGRYFRLPTENDIMRAKNSAEQLKEKILENKSKTPILPEEALPPHGTLGFRIQQYGMKHWEDLYTPRQLLYLTTLVESLSDVAKEFSPDMEEGLKKAVLSILACAIDRSAEHSTSLCRWNASGQKIQATFGRQALPMLWDFAETNPFGGSVGSWKTMLDIVTIPFETVTTIDAAGQAQQASATRQLLPDNIAEALVTDPPYYDAVPYADLSDFFYVWMKRTIGHIYPELFKEQLSPKTEECIVDPVKGKDKLFFESGMTQSLSEARRVLSPNGIGVVVFAHKTTAGWEAQIQAMLDAGWIITGSWPIDTEMETRLRAMRSAALSSSVHLVCRPREDINGNSNILVGDWREVLFELPKKINDWLPRLSSEGIVGADAIFACLGPALEIFSKYDRVEKASGEKVTLNEYLEYVWSAVSREALSMIFEGADATGFEEDARLTAMWMWTLKSIDGSPSPMNGQQRSLELDEEVEKEGVSVDNYVLEYDAARKIAQGLGAHLERLDHLVEIKGSSARLRSVSERARYLFGKSEEGRNRKIKKKAESTQLSFASLIDDVETQDSGFEEHKSPQPGQTTLDRLHQSMLLFASGRNEALKLFLIDEGVGKDAGFWRLAQALSALYPSGSEEKRWVDGVLARKKGLGL